MSYFIIGWSQHHNVPGGIWWPVSWVFWTEQEIFWDRIIHWIQWRLQDFFVGGANGGLNSSEGVLKKLIKLRESNERLNFSYQFFYIQQLRKGTIYFFSAVINFSYATVISNNVKYDNYKVK